jgi:transketolase
LTGGANNPVVYQSNVPYETGIANRLTDGSDVAIFACGTAVHTCLQAAKIVSELGISAATYDMHTIKPIDREIIKKTAKTHRLLVSVEEHNVIGGLGSAISEILSDISGSPQLLTLGVEDNFLKPGSYKYMLEQCGLNPQAVADAICRALHQEKNHK